MSIIGSNVLAGASGQAGYNLNNSLRFRSSASAYLSRTMNASSTTFTVSCWVKRGALGTYQYIFSSGPNTAANDKGLAYNDTTNTIYIYNGSTQVASTAVYRDPSAWYHVVMSVSSGTAKVYINGNDIGLTHTSMSLGTYGKIGRYNDTNLNQFDGYLADYNCIDGQALTPSSFGETSTTTGTWIPKAYSGSYGTNGFKLNFSDTSAATAAAIGKDSSGNGNNWTPSGISVTAGTTYDAMIDVPTNTSATVANYCVLNPLTNAGTLSGANLSLTTTSSGQSNTFGTIYVSSGKWYWEITSTADAAVGTMIGITDSSIAFASGGYYQSALGYGYYSQGGTKHNNSTSVAYGSSYTTNDVIGVALDMDAGTLTFYKNNTSQGTAFSSLTGLFAPAVCDGGTGSISVAANFGQRPFTYTPPSGYVALNTYNLPTPTILQGNKYMDATLYTGTGASLAITNAGAFQPDFVWVKGRSGATSHALYDSVRGTTKDLVSDSTAVETTQTTGLTAFGTGGFTVGALAKMNTSAATYVGWQWLAGAGSSSSNTSGSITSTVSVNTTAGFSIVTYVNPASGSFTIGHGLGVAPKMIITKSTDTVSPWPTWFTGFTNGEYVNLNTTAAKASQTNYWGTAVPTSTVFGNTVGTTWNSGVNVVAYCWAEIAGFSAFGSYTGNGSADGPFVATNFRPKFVMVKCSSSSLTGGAYWVVQDTSRSTYNASDNILYPSLSNSEGDGEPIDILSNGFKIRNSLTRWNSSGDTFIYMAYAENPFKNANAR